MTKLQKAIYSLIITLSTFSFIWWKFGWEVTVAAWLFLWSINVEFDRLKDYD